MSCYPLQEGQQQTLQLIFFDGEEALKKWSKTDRLSDFLGSVGQCDQRWLDYFGIFGHLYQRKFSVPSSKYLPK